ncbi:MAGa7180 family putative nuclease [Candidatus Mycoplasma pogonae]
MVKRHFYNNREYVLDKVNKVVILKPEFHQKLLNKQLWGKFGFKKIGGSSIADVLLTDNFKSHFAAFAKIAWLSMPVLDPKYVNAGVAIEPKVVEALETKLNIEIETFPPEQYNYDYFAGKDDIIGGIPDGYIPKNESIIEIKTAGEKKYYDWEKYGVPLAYLKQAQLYTYLMNKEKFYIVATFLKEEDYAHPKNFPIKNRKLKAYPYKLNRDQAMDDIQKVKQWYQFYTQKGISPQYNEAIDGDLIDWLECENEDQLQTLLDKWKALGKYVESQ